MDAGNDLKRICAWCGKDMGTKPGGEGVTHGMCPECVKKVEEEEMMTPTEKRNAQAAIGAKKWGPIGNASEHDMDEWIENFIRACDKEGLEENADGLSKYLLSAGVGSSDAQKIVQRYKTGWK